MNAFEQELFKVLDMAVLESKDGELFEFVGAIPEWFTELYPELEEIKGSIRIGRKFLFLAHFLTDAQEFWSEQIEGRLKSGSWLETDKDGKMHQVEATAVNLQSKKVLILESGKYSSQEKKYLLSKGNAFSFDTKMLEAFEHHETQIRQDIREKMEVKYRELKDENESLKVQIGLLQKN